MINENIKGENIVKIINDSFVYLAKNRNVIKLELFSFYYGKETTERIFSINYEGNIILNN